MWPSLSESVSILCYILSNAREKTKGIKQNYKETWIDLRYTHREESKWFSWMRVMFFLRVPPCCPPPRCPVGCPGNASPSSVATTQPDGPAVPYFLTSPATSRLGCRALPSMIPTWQQAAKGARWCHVTFSRAKLLTRLYSGHYFNEKPLTWSVMCKHRLQ